MSFLTRGLKGGKGSASRHGRSLPPRKTRYSLYRRLGGTQGRSGQVRKISPPRGFDPRTVQPVASRYTDYATRSTTFHIHMINLCNLWILATSWERCACTSRDQSVRFPPAVGMCYVGQRNDQRSGYVLSVRMCANYSLGCSYSSPFWGSLAK